MSNRMKLNYVVDIAIGVAFIAAAVTGIAFLFLGSGGYRGGTNPGFATSFLGVPRDTWRTLHNLYGAVTIAGVGLHMALHVDWFACATRRLLRARA